MEAVDLLKTRQSIRKYKDQVVDRELMNEIIDITRFAPSWANVQIARYNLIEDKSVIQRIAEEGVNDHVYNKKTLTNASNVCVLSYVRGKSGRFDGGDLVTNKTDWEVFDAGIAAHQFCLAAHAKGVGTVIFGVIDDKSIANIIGLPEEETVGAVIVYGHTEKIGKRTPRMEVEELVRFI